MARRQMQESIQNAVFNTRCNPDITEEQRREYVWGEFELVGEAIDTKIIETSNKAGIFRFINVLSSLAILAFSAIIIGLQAASDCINIPVICFSSLIFLIEGTHKLLNWGPQGITYKQSTIRLKRVRRQIRNVMLQYHTFSTEWLMAIIGQFWTEYDDIDVGLYKLTTPGPVKYDTGISIEPGPAQDNTNNHVSPFPSLESSQVLAANHGAHTQPNLHENKKTNINKKPSPHFHIHIDNNSNNKLNKNKLDNSKYKVVDDAETVLAPSPIKLLPEDNNNNNDNNNSNKQELPKINVEPDSPVKILDDTSITKRNIIKHMEQLESEDN